MNITIKNRKCPDCGRTFDHQWSRSCPACAVQRQRHSKEWREFCRVMGGPWWDEFDEWLADHVTAECKWCQRTLSTSARC
jgi:hypothetical protein